MCGIGGVSGFNTSEIESKKHVLLNVQHHRGPDASAVFLHNNTFLFHNRLSIIDLSSAAAQPFHSACGNYVVVFNGEIYNYQALRSELLQRGVSLRSNSDTEVVLEMFVLEGAACVQRFEGMFAFAVLNKNTGEISLFRDRLGIKPLFYFHKGNRFAFASELKLLTTLLKRELSLNYNSIGRFLHVGYIPAPSTVYNEINALNPGCSLQFSDSKIVCSQFWSVKNKINPTVNGNFSANVHQLKELMQQSVRKHLVSDVPVGVFLSGGIDSSLVAALASKQYPSTLKTFSLGTTDKKFDETSYARTIAKHLGADHNELIVSPADIIKSVNAALQIYDQPFADSSAIPTMLLSQMASQQVKVCLSGEGADELFGGYGSYKWAMRLKNPFIRNSRKTLKAVLRNFSGERYKKAVRMLNFTSRDFLPSHIFSCEQNFFTTSEIARLMNFEPWQYEEVTIMKEMNSMRQLAPAEEQSFFDLINYLPDDLLVKVDRASMFHSLEVRVPYLDHEVVEFAMNIPVNHKIQGGNQKRILKEILYQELPKEFFNRPKRGFSIPISTWLKTDLKYLIEENLSEEVLKKYNVVQNIGEVKKLVDRHASGEDHLYNRIWALIVLHKWLSANT